MGMLDDYIIKQSKKIICSVFCLEKGLEYLGHGSEGVVFRDSFTVYKYFYRTKENGSLDDLFCQLKNVQRTVMNNIQSKLFEVVRKDDDLIVYYPNDNFSKFTGAPLEAFIKLLRNFRSMGIVHSNIRTKNIVLSGTGNLFICDIGKSMTSWDDAEYEVMTQALFTIYKLQKNVVFLENEYDYLTRKNLSIDNVVALLNDSSVKLEYELFKGAVWKSQ